MICNTHNKWNLLSKVAKCEGGLQKLNIFAHVDVAGFLPLRLHSAFSTSK